MKTKIIFLVCCLILSVIFTSCSKNATENQTSANPETVESEFEEPTTVTDISEEQAVVTDTSAELTAPVMEWWELYNPNGYDTVTALITNPNSVAVDVSYDLVFYKDGKEVSRIEYCGNESILPEGNSIIWINADVPSSADADDVKMENINVTQTLYPPIDGKFEYAGIIDGEACYDFTFDSKPSLATIWFVEYNDTNGNGKFDKGEIVVTSTSSITEQTGRASFNADLYAHTDCDVYFTATE